MVSVLPRHEPLVFSEGLEYAYFQDAQHDAEPVLEQVSLVKAKAEGGGEGKAFFRGGEL